MKRKKKRVGLLTKIFIAVFAVYAAVTLVNLQIRINAAAAEQEALQSRLEAQKLVCAELNDAIAEGDNEDYIAKVARESLGYVFPGEQVFVDISSK
ncbi:MAG: septum formation initiator family protein [Clostridia bacterium]|nr:septum formation initiator family protein [Clostridia bacterium]